MAFDFDNGNRQEKRKNRLVRLLIWIVEIAIAIFLGFLVIHFGFQKIKMYGESMSPTLAESDSIMVNKLDYRFSSPKRGDVIVFKQSGQEHSYYNVKRVIGLPGETIEIKEGIVYIDGTKYKEIVEVEEISNSGLAATPYKLEDGEYFVLGDNRNGSVDSRFASFGTVIKDDIIGKAWIRMNKFAFIGNLNRRKEVEETETPSATPIGGISVSPTPTAK
ncbi:MAG: signal peptidase I [bacterium]|nr:signal peptidase I [bacterium]